MHGQDVVRLQLSASRELWELLPSIMDGHSVSGDRELGLESQDEAVKSPNRGINQGERVATS